MLTCSNVYTFLLAVNIFSLFYCYQYYAHHRVRLFTVNSNSYSLHTVNRLINQYFSKCDIQHFCGASVFLSVIHTAIQLIFRFYILTFHVCFLLCSPASIIKVTEITINLMYISKYSFLLIISN